MKPRRHKKAAAPKTRIVAAIDVGSSALRLLVASVGEDGTLEPLEELQRPVRLGHDTFRRGRLSTPTIRAAVAVLRDFHRLLDFYEVTEVRAVATSAVREANNADTFLDRVYITSGLELEVIDTSEESRLIMTAVHEAAGKALSEKGGCALVADVGGGSTLLTQLVDGDIVASQSLDLGAIRLHEVFPSGQAPARFAESVHQQVASALAAIVNTIPLGEVTLLMGVGGDARFAARQCGHGAKGASVAVIKPKALDKLVAACVEHSADELAKLYGLEFGEAETLAPALIVYQELLRHTQAQELWVCKVAMRDGLLLDLAHSLSGRDDDSLERGVVHSATAIAEKYHADVAHSLHVADLAMQLFDALAAEHHLDGRERLLLRVAAILHDVGSFVSLRAHHKHSFYLIANSELFGLTRDEVLIIAHTARYHRRSPPKPAHLEYMGLPRERRMVVTKLAAILRVADALDRVHAGRIATLRCTREGDELVLQAKSAFDLGLERQAVSSKSDLFTDIYGLTLRLEGDGAGAARGAAERQ